MPLSTDEYLSAEDDTAGDGEACAIIEPSELALFVPVLLGGVFIKKGIVPPPPCANIDVEYGIEGDYTEMTRIGMIVCETVSSVFRRALNGMESRRIFNALKVTENLTQAPQKQSMKEAFQFWK